LAYFLLLRVSVEALRVEGCLLSTVTTLTFQLDELADFVALLVQNFAKIQRCILELREYLYAGVLFAYAARYYTSHTSFYCTFLAMLLTHLATIFPKLTIKDIILISDMFFI